MRVPLPLGLEGCHPCLKGAHPFFLLPNHRQQVDDQFLDDHRRLFPAWDPAAVLRAVGGRQPQGDPRDVQPVFPWMVNAAVIAQNPANFQQKLADEPGAVILYCYPLKAYGLFSSPM